MKKPRSIGLLVLLFIFVSPGQIFAQTTHLENNSFELSLKIVQTGDTYYLSGGTEEIHITPSGNFKRTITFQLDPDDPFLALAMPYAVIRMSLWADIDNDGIDDVKLRDKRTVITPSGLVKVDFHYNGK